MTTGKYVIKKSMPKKYLKLDERQAQHCLELMLEHFCVGCSECDTTKAKLEKFIGKTEVRWTKNVIKKNPYCTGINKIYAK